MICLLVSGAFISCNKNVAPPTADNGKGNPTSYLLEQITYLENGNTGGIDFYFRFNADNLVSEISRVSWGFITTDNNPPVRQENNTTYSFEYVNQQAVRCTQKENAALWTFEYEYAGDLIRRKIIRHAGGSIQDSTLYKYNTDGKLTELVMYKDKADFRSEFNHSDNLITRTNYILNTTPQSKYKIEFSRFDKKVNFIRAINGLPKAFGGEEYSFFYYATPAAGNYTQTKYFNFVGINENFGGFTVGNFTYQYNEEGLPTRMISDHYSATFKYRKYK